MDTHRLVLLTTPDREPYPGDPWICLCETWGHTVFGRSPPKLLIWDPA